MKGEVDSVLTGFLPFFCLKGFQRSISEKKFFERTQIV